jgi:hypothetical protein
MCVCVCVYCSLGFQKVTSHLTYNLQIICFFNLSHLSIVLRCRPHILADLHFCLSIMMRGVGRRAGLGVLFLHKVWFSTVKVFNINHTLATFKISVEINVKVLIRTFTLTIWILKLFCTSWLPGVAWVFIYPNLLSDKHTYIHLYIYIYIYI